jgi:hypothetical protein
MIEAAVMDARIWRVQKNEISLSHLLCRFIRVGNLARPNLYRVN